MKTVQNQRGNINKYTLESAYRLLDDCFITEIDHYVLLNCSKLIAFEVKITSKNNFKIWTNYYDNSNKQIHFWS